MENVFECFETLTRDALFNEALVAATVAAEAIARERISSKKKNCFNREQKAEQKQFHVYSPLIT